MFTIAKINVFNGEGVLKAFVDVMFNGNVLVKGIRLLQFRDATFAIRMPDEKDKKTDKFIPIVSIMDVSLRKEMEEKIISEYKKMFNDPKTGV